MLRLKKLSSVRALLDFNPYRRERWIQQQAIEIPAGSRVLDIGAGSCPYRHHFSHCDYYAHDFEGLAPQQLYGKDGYGRIDFRSDILDIPVEDESFDAVLCTEVIEHVPEPIRVLDVFARVLKPGGILLLSAPLGSGLHQEPYHYYGGFTPFWYRRFLPDAGFEVLSIQANGGFFMHFGQESLRFVRMSAPWKIGFRGAGRIAWPVFWIGLAPVLAFFVPLICLMLDTMDRHRGFTVGYHVAARKHGTA